METMDELSGYLSDKNIKGTESKGASLSDSNNNSNSESNSDSEPMEVVKRKYSSADEEEVSRASVGSNRKIANNTEKITVENYKYMPLRLTEEERRLLTVLENALEVCEYTDVVDVTFSHTRKSKVSRIFENLIDVLSISSGLVVRCRL